MYRRDGSGADVEGTLRRRFVLLERQFQRAVAAELRAAAVQIPAQRRRAVSPFQIDNDGRHAASPRTRFPYGSAQPQTMRPSQSITIVLHGQEHVKRVAR